MGTITYNVPDISCDHCKQAIEGKVSRLQGVAWVEVDVQTKTVSVSGEPLDKKAILAAIDEAGYEVAA